MEAIHPDDLAETKLIFLKANASHLPFSVDYRVLRDRPALLYGIVLLGLGLVLTPLGAQKRGIQAWYEIGSFQLQPSEFAKLGVVLVLAAYCHEHKGHLDAWRLGAEVWGYGERGSLEPGSQIGHERCRGRAVSAA